MTILIGLGWVAVVLIAAGSSLRKKASSRPGPEAGQNGKVVTP